MFDGSDARDLPALSLTWRDGLFAHWPVDPSRVRPLVPDELDVETREGTAWVSALPSLVTASRPWFLPEAVGLTFPQVTLRTYVRHETRPGVYFLSVDADTALGVGIARALWDLPYHRADVDFETVGETRRVDSRRVDPGEPPARFAAAYRPTGEAVRPDPDSLSAFLAERHRLYLVRDGTVRCARVEHEPWRLCPAEASVHADALLEAAGLPAPAEDPMVRYAPGASFAVRTPFRARARGG
ncbi:YqjF family protein [Halorussus sp. AFM4]|uniref:YqjF family protein n=1 Tax=Halorussus sp. AFM4 TaxID=3421651 RepID=UPI003EC0A2A4